MKGEIPEFNHRVKKITAVSPLGWAHSVLIDKDKDLKYAVPEFISHLRRMYMSSNLCLFCGAPAEKHSQTTCINCDLVTCKKCSIEIKDEDYPTSSYLCARCWSNI